MATRPCYAIHFLHIVLSYIFLYDLILSNTLHLRFHSDYRIDIHDRFERESHHVCHSLYCKTPTLLNVIMIVVELIRGPMIEAGVD